MKEKFDFNDILIEPEQLTQIRSRKQINPYYNIDFREKLPIFVAPMDTVVSPDNIYKFTNKHLNVCLPRTSSNIKKIGNFFTSYSLTEIVDILDNKRDNQLANKILIDIANGHMEDLLETTKRLRDYVHYSVQIMVGNIANPKTYKLLSEAGADFIRVGIGNGNGCLTTQQTGIGYPMGSLIVECKELANSLDNPAKIVADGGMKTYSDIIKALALGADYVMIGSLLNKTLESSGKSYFCGLSIKPKLASKLYNKGFKITKKFRGMSTKEVQKSWGNKTFKTSEGVVRYRKVEYTLQQWVDNFRDYLKSAMSYTNSNNLEEFVGNVNYNMITDNAYARFKK